MRKAIVDGVYPTMITPFKENLTIDVEALERLVEWYFTRGIDGLFAVCQSSAMFELSRKERKALCTLVVDFAAGRCPVMASGHVSDTLDDQMIELNDMAEAGADALVLVSNRLAGPRDSDDVWLKNLERLMDGLPEDIPLGVYECPYPYKRLLSDRIVEELVASGRFGFVKDTCCDPETIARRAELTSGSPLKLFNANAATLLFCLRKGYAGYSGIMTNFHADLYHRLCSDWRNMGDEADELQDYLGMASVIEYQSYPANAKHSLMLDGVLNNRICRRQDARLSDLTESQRLETEQFHALSAAMSRRFARQDAG